MHRRAGGKAEAQFLRLMRQKFRRAATSFAEGEIIAGHDMPNAANCMLQNVFNKILCRFRRKTPR